MKRKWKVSECLYGDNRARNCFFVSLSGCIKFFKRFPTAPAKTWKQLAVIKKVPSKDFRNSKYDMSVSNRFYNLAAQPVTEFNNTLLVAGRAKMPAFAWKSQQVFVSAFFAFDPRKSVMQNAAIKVAINYLFDIRTEKAILPGKPVIIDLFKGFKMILHALIVGWDIRISPEVYGFCLDVFDPLPLRIKATALAKSIPELKRVFNCKMVVWYYGGWYWNA